MKKKHPQELRPLNLPRCIRVKTGAGGRPLVVYMKGRPRRVHRILDIWQIDDEWWRDPISRRYATLILDDEGAVTVYRNLLDGRWYSQEG
jgi:hypothetical protein